LKHIFNWFSHGIFSYEEVSGERIKKVYNVLLLGIAFRKLKQPRVGTEVAWLFPGLARCHAS
jgi:hypothetical protein